MPKSKRVKPTEGKRQTKGFQAKEALVNEIRSSLEKYNSIYIFSVANMRNSKLKDVRSNWKHSRFFFGKNKVMAVGLGRTEEEEQQPNLHKVSEKLKGDVGILFTSQPRDEVESWFASYNEKDFARSGFTATETVSLRAGPLSQFPHSMEPNLRQLGLPTALKNGVVTLEKDHTVCTEGDTLTPEQARILKLLDKPLAEFHITLRYLWTNGEFHKLTDDDDEEGEGEDDNDEMDDE